MNFTVSLTAKGTISYPLHKHDRTEIMLYGEGNGVMATECGELPFAPDTVIIIPKNMLHGSKSENGFCNLSVSADLSMMTVVKEPVVLVANEDIKALGEILSRHIYEDGEYVASLVEAYFSAVFSVLGHRSRLDEAIDEVLYRTQNRFFEESFRITDEIKKSGYCEDYFRSEFKKRVGKVPVEYQNALRTELACRLMAIFGSSVSMTEIAYKCGFSDSAYFSKIFKKMKGVSPSRYALSVIGE